MTGFPTLTVWQPWATLVAEEYKPLEFRGWPAPARYHHQRIAIHAAARPVRVAEVRALLVKLHSPSWRETGLVREPAIALLEKVKDRPGDLPLSSVVCTAILGVPLQQEALANRLGFEMVNDSDRHEHSNWGWPLTAVERVMPPAPARGQQGWWKWYGP